MGPLHLGPATRINQPSGGDGRWILLCQDVCHAASVDGAVLTLATEADGLRVGSCGSRAADGDDLQRTNGTGPTPDALAGDFVMVADLRMAEDRWPLLARLAVTAGVAGVFALPLNIDDQAVGALTLYRDEPGRWSPPRAAEALLAAEGVAVAIATVLARGDGLAGDLEGAFAHEAPLQQAAGMAAVQLGVSVKEAWACLRAHAFATNCVLSDVAQDVLSKELVFSATN